MPARETGKTRSLQIPLDYYKAPEGLLRAKRWLSIGALVLVGAWGAYAFGTRDDMAASRGPVAAVHAAWDANCTACHVEFSPMSDQNWAVAALGLKHDAELNCQGCHTAPTHHKGLTNEPGCTHCHHDHRGRDASLTRLPDSVCTSCHQDALANHIDTTKRQGPPFGDGITRFDLDHPQFRITLNDGKNDTRAFLNLPDGRDNPEVKDPGRLKFNHKLHMSAGLTHSDAARPMYLSAIGDLTERERFRRQGQDKQTDERNLVQLDCASCHRTDATPHSGASASYSRPATAYMQPVNYETHCRVCHPLTFDKNMPEVSVPHGLQPPAVHQFLWGAMAERVVKDLQTPEAKSSLPGKRVADIEKQAVADTTGRIPKLEKFLFQDEVALTERYLYSGKTSCGECHYMERDAGVDVPKRIVPPAVPEVWLPHSVFNHAAHRALDCRACHARAYPDSRDSSGRPNASVAESDILLPGIQVCIDCHRPAQTSGGTFLGGARFDCTGCHRYHFGDSPSHGQAARDRNLSRTLDIAEFLQGPSKRKTSLHRD